MNQTEFNNVVNEQIEYCQKLLGTKRDEYNIKEEGKEVDRLSHFKKSAVLMNTSPEYALLGMLMKHWVSVADMCRDANNYTLDRWTEKITDSINYLLLLKGLIVESHTKLNDSVNNAGKNVEDKTNSIPYAKPEIISLDSLAISASDAPEVHLEAETVTEKPVRSTVRMRG